MEVIEEKRIKNIDQDEVEIRLSDIIQFLKANRRKMLIGGILGLLIGALYIIPKPNIYTVEVTIMPEIQGRGVSALGVLAAGSSLGGLGDNTGALDNRPDLYPEVLGSIPFAMHILKQAVYSKNLGGTMTLEEFINKSSTASIITKVKDLFTIDDSGKGGKSDPKNVSQAIQVTKEQYGLIKAVQSSVTSSFDKKTGIITVTATQSDPVVAATVAHLSLDYLTHYIIEYRTDKARRRVRFLMQQVLEAKQRYEKAQYTLSDYRDRHISVYLNTAKIDEQRLQADYLLEQSVYNDLARQLELAKVKVEEDTPTIKVLEPPVIPTAKSGPKRTLTILGFGLAGALITLGILFIRSRNLFA